MRRRWFALTLWAALADPSQGAQAPLAQSADSTADRSSTTRAGTCAGHFTAGVRTANVRAAGGSGDAAGTCSTVSATTRNAGCGRCVRWSLVDHVHLPGGQRRPWLFLPRRR